jgi:hypothetical protein
VRTKMALFSSLSFFILPYRALFTDCNLSPICNPGFSDSYINSLSRDPDYRNCNLTIDPPRGSGFLQPKADVRPEQVIDSGVCVPILSIATATLIRKPRIPSQTKETTGTLKTRRRAPCLRRRCSQPW